MVDRLQRVRDLAERTDDGLLIAGERRVVAFDGCLLLSLEGSAVEDRCRQARSKTPERGTAIA
ncbi:hypothetical protein D3C75_1297780 [compost metagenome]